MTLLLTFFAFCFAGKVLAKSVPLSSLLSKGALKTRVHLLPVNQGFLVNVELQNLTRERLELFIEPGRILNSIPEEYQDLVVARRVEVTVQPMSSGRACLEAYCKNKPKKGPSWETPMELGPMAAQPLVRLCRYIAGQSFRPMTIQHAVWVVSDSFPMPPAILVSDPVANGSDLMRYLDIDVGREHADHVLELRSDEEDDGTPRVLLNDDYNTSKAGMVRIVFTDFKGNELRELMAPIRRIAGPFDLQVNMLMEDLRSGIYFIKVFSDEQLQKQWEIFI